MKSGIPFDRAFDLEDHEVLAFLVVLGRFEGTAEWSWDDMRWYKKDPSDG